MSASHEAEQTMTVFDQAMSDVSTKAMCDETNITVYTPPVVAKLRIFLYTGSTEEWINLKVCVDDYIMIVKKKCGAIIL
jgi:hypothetical protein